MVVIKNECFCNCQSVSTINPDQQVYKKNGKAKSITPYLTLGGWMDDISYKNFSTCDWEWDDCGWACNYYNQKKGMINYQCAKACPYASMYLWAIICLQTGTQISIDTCVEYATVASFGDVLQGLHKDKDTNPWLNGTKYSQDKFQDKFDIDKVYVTCKIESNACGQAASGYGINDGNVQRFTMNLIIDNLIQLQFLKISDIPNIANIENIKNNYWYNDVAILRKIADKISRTGDGKANTGINCMLIHHMYETQDQLDLIIKSLILAKQGGLIESMGFSNIKYDNFKNGIINSSRNSGLSISDILDMVDIVQNRNAFNDKEPCTMDSLMSEKAQNGFPDLYSGNGEYKGVNRMQYVSTLGNGTGDKKLINVCFSLTVDPRESQEYCKYWVKNYLSNGLLYKDFWEEASGSKDTIWYPCTSTHKAIPINKYFVYTYNGCYFTTEQSCKEWIKNHFKPEYLAIQYLRMASPAEHDGNGVKNTDTRTKLEGTKYNIWNNWRAGSRDQDPYISTYKKNKITRGGKIKIVNEKDLQKLGLSWGYVVKGDYRPYAGASVISNHEVCKYYFNEEEYPINQEELNNLNWWDDFSWENDWVLNIPNKSGWGNIITFVNAANSEYPKDMFPGKNS